MLLSERYRSALVGVGLQPITFEYFSETATSVNTLDIEIARLKMGDYDAIVIDKQVIVVVV